MTDTQPQHSGETRAEKTSRRVAAIVLAAGSSRRMGADNKLLLDIDGSPMLRSSVQNAIASNVQSTIVVLGHEAEDVAGALQGLQCQVEINEDYSEGMATSLRAGIKAAKGFDAVAILLGDMPIIEPSVLNTLLEVYVQQPASTILVATHAGRRGHPVIWPAECFPDLMSLIGDVGGKQLLEKYSRRVIEVEMDTDSILIDIDTPQDWNAAQPVKPT